MTEGARDQGREAGKMSRRTAAWLAWLLWALTTVCALSMIVLREQGSSIAILPVAAWVVTSSTVGVLIVSRRFENPIGWILCVNAFLFALSIFSGTYAVYTLVTHPGSLPAGEVAAWFSAWVQNPVYLLFAFLFLLFPNGRPLSRRWRLLLWINGILIATTIVVEAFDPGRVMGDEPIRNPLGIEAVAGVFGFVAEVVGYLTVILMIVSAISIFLRFHRAGEIERQQIKWLAYAAALLGAVFIVGTIGDLLLGGFGPWSFLALVAALFAIPLSIGAAMLRYRLYDIDLVINRTLVYGSLTAMLALVYFGGVATTQEIFHALTDQEQQPQLAIVVSTLAIAALFNPLRRRIQAFIDRRFYRRKYDARKTLDAFSAKLRDETDLEALNYELMAVIRETMQPAHVSLWLRNDMPSEGE
ncbi:MAG: hypothetical protein M3305_04950 [Actinomycetota bacterium]|nr:hypothetical protein [Actinomycetota bacterium]